MNKPNEKLETIFEAALALKTAAERAEYLAHACPDENLRREVESLLRAHAHPDSAFEENTIVINLAPTERPGTRIGRYKLLQQIGEGGMGVVYMAEQEEPVRRRVALKIIKLGMDTRSVVARFEAERQALALMDHPNIARVLDGGATETGRPYFVMELVQGVPITEFCNKAKLPATERIRLFMQVCQAVQHAHQKGIIHRDIKPSNVLVTLHDGIPVPKVIDFGIAKATNQRLTEKTLFTNFASMIGTPAYMSPEQAELSGLDIDTRADIYALGVLLYELLTGSTPFPEKRLRSLAYGEMQRVILEEEPERPSTRLSTMSNEQRTVFARDFGEEMATLHNLLRGDLDWIVMKCLEKDRQRRYETANGLAADLKRHLENEPVVARPPSFGYKVRKAIRRNKLAYASAAVVAGTLLLGLAVSTWQTAVASRARNREREANQQLRNQVAETESARKRADQAAQSETQQRLRISGMLEQMQLQKAEDLLAGSQSPLGISYLVQMLRSNPSNTVATARLVSAVTRPFAIPLAEPMQHDNPVSSVQFSSDGSFLLTVSSQTVRVWDAHTGKPITQPMRHEQLVRWAQFSPDGSRLVTASDDKTARIWDSHTGLPVGQPFRHEHAVTCAQFSADGTRIVTACSEFWNGFRWRPFLDEAVQVWDALKGSAITEPLRAAAPALVAQFSADGSEVLAISSDGITRRWNARTGDPLSNLAQAAQAITISGQLSSNATRLVESGAGIAFYGADGYACVGGGPNQNAARVWDLNDGRLLGEPLRHEDRVVSCRLSPDGLRVITASVDKTARVWDARSGLPITGPMRHEDAVIYAEFSQDGLRVVTASQDNTARVWDALTGLPLTEPIRHQGPVWTARFSPDGTMIATSSYDNTARLWDIRASNPLTEPLGHEHMVNTAEFSPDDSKVLTASADKTASLWDARTGLPIGEPFRHEGAVRVARFSPDGLKVLTASEDNTARLWDARTAQPFGERLRHEGPVIWAEFSHDGSKVVTASDDFTARVWDAHTGLALTNPLRHEDRINSVRFSPDDSRVLTSSRDTTARLWDARTGLPMGAPLKLEGHFNFAEFSPDGQRILISSDRTPRVCDALTGQLLVRLVGHENVPISAQFSPDGSRVVTTSEDRTARVWDARTGHMLGVLQHAGSVRDAQFCPDGSRLVTCSEDQTARVWDVLTCLPVSEPLRNGDMVTCVRFSHDGSKVITGTGVHDKVGRIWDVFAAPAQTVPAWFLDWAEARAGFRSSDTRDVGPVLFSEQRRLWEQVQARKETDLFTRIAQWTQVEPLTRAISPLASLSTAEYVKRRIEENTPESLHEALLLSSKEGLAWARQALKVSHLIAEDSWPRANLPLQQSYCESVSWAWQILHARHSEGNQAELLLAKAEQEAQRAFSLRPNLSETWQAMGTVQWLRNRPAEALASLDRALALQPDAGEILELKGDILAQQERNEEALEAYSRRIALLPATNNVPGCPRLQTLDKHAALCRKVGRWTQAITDLQSGGVPPRDPAADNHMIDLSAFYNLELGDVLSAMPTGIRTLDGTSFDVRGSLFLASGKSFPNRVPDSVRGIPIGFKGRRVRFLHACYWGVDSPGTQIGSYVLHFADGTAQERPLLLGRDLMDIDSDVPSGEGTLKVGCAFERSTLSGKISWHLFLTTWDNPHPETEITSLDFVSARQTAAPFLVAVTVE